MSLKGSDTERSTRRNCASTLHQWQEITFTVTQMFDKHPVSSACDTIHYLLLKDIYLSPCEWIELFSRQKEMSSFMSEAAAVAFVTSSVAFFLMQLSFVNSEKVGLSHH